VIDNGYGIPQESLPHIFDKFYRVTDSEGTEEVEGSGLGLTLAREIIERHGGTITVNSRLGVGSVFTFSIPYT
jgi:signal transduction histidine kinase